MNRLHKARVHKGKVAFTARNTPSRRVLAAEEFEANGKRYLRTLHATKGWRTERVPV